MNKSQIPFAKQTRHLPDPGDTGSIDCGVYHVVSCALFTGASAETRTILAPSTLDQRLTVWMDTDGGGDATVTVNGGHLVASLTFDDQGDIAQLYAISVAGVIKWIQLPV